MTWRTCGVSLVVALLLSGAGRAQTAPFTLADPAANSTAITVQNTATPASGVTTIIPRLTGPEKPPESLHDSQTGARLEEFGTAYSYANPLYGTTHLGGNEVGGQQGGGAAGQPTMFSFVVARFGAPPDPLPPIAGIDPSTNQADVALIRYALQADTAFPDLASERVIDLALHSMGRARVTQIDITTTRPLADRAARAALLRLVALAFLHEGVHPGAILADGRRVLPHVAAERGAPVPGHVFTLVLAQSS